jgi:hypothetical protein
MIGISWSVVNTKRQNCRKFFCGSQSGSKICRKTKKTVSRAKGENCPRKADVYRQSRRVVFAGVVNAFSTLHFPMKIREYKVPASKPANLAHSATVFLSPLCSIQVFRRVLEFCSFCVAHLQFPGS